MKVDIDTNVSIRFPASVGTDNSLGGFFFLDSKLADRFNIKPVGVAVRHPSGGKLVVCLETMPDFTPTRFLGIATLKDSEGATEGSFNFVHGMLIAVLDSGHLLDLARRHHHLCVSLYFEEA